MADRRAATDEDYLFLRYLRGYDANFSLERVLDLPDVTRRMIRDKIALDQQELAGQLPCPGAGDPKERLWRHLIAEHGLPPESLRTMTPDEMRMYIEARHPAARDSRPRPPENPQDSAETVVAGRDPAADEPLRPQWDPALRELSYGPNFSKRYVRPAPRQEKILATFQDDGWPRRIDDPLDHGQLKDTIRDLKKSLGSSCPLRFERDGTGEGITWRVVDVSGASPPDVR
jgi:hypothetical protein